MSRVNISSSNAKVGFIIRRKASIDPIFKSVSSVPTSDVANICAYAYVSYAFGTMEMDEDSDGKKRTRSIV